MAARVEQVRPATALTAEKTLELAKQAENLYKSQDPAEQRRLLESGAIELHFRSWHSLSYLQFIAVWDEFAS